jgi:hypothetical protein
MNAVQLELTDQRPAIALRSRLEELLEVLKADGGWMSRRVLEGRGFGERELRMLCELDSAGSILSYPGAPGYKFFDLATVQELERSRALLNQGKKMIARWVRYERRRRSGKAQ